MEWLAIVCALVFFAFVVKGRKKDKVDISRATPPIDQSDIFNFFDQVDLPEIPTVDYSTTGDLPTAEEIREASRKIAEDITKGVDL